MSITGELFIAGERVANGETYKAVDPSTGKELRETFSIASTADVAKACEAAGDAFASYSASAPEDRARFLEAIADNIEALGDELLERGVLETGLPTARLTGERGRTANQLRLFASELRDGGYEGVRIDSALPDREPAPRPALRTRKVALGPVAVFGASNFPLAFSVAGGDTASALAAGCPVVVKAHPAHPGVCELVAGAIAKAVKDCGLHKGVFSMVADTGHKGGQALVADPNIKAVGFTGSRGGGLALMKIAAERAEPIPVYAEMSAVNPVVLFKGALEKDAAGLGEAFVGSLTMGAGQFCTNPGLVFAIDRPELDAFVDAARKAVEAASPQVMLTAGIKSAYDSGVEKLAQVKGVKKLARGEDGDACGAGPALFEAAADIFEGDAALSEEVFGASSVLVRCKDEASLIKALERLEGQLTATLHLTESDHALASKVLPVLERKAGRILANGWPTGVEVCHAMVHGGPFPATSDTRSTSVGTMAIDRFLRPVCLQNIPEALLPASLKGQGLDGRLRRVDGEWRS
ncbi:aldehyde dehydrogenase (NADP(+)) [Oceanicaulis sp.]|uniref:aldehyde dehydrogenase (NADP(+)) n=1 Tax=Oceanicaulis sp. TaxID=1924941 RepID=UPI003F72D6C4